MKLIKMIMVVAVAAGVLGLGACAQQKRSGTRTRASTHQFKIVSHWRCRLRYRFVVDSSSLNRSRIPNSSLIRRLVESLKSKKSESHQLPA